MKITSIYCNSFFIVMLFLLLTSFTSKPSSHLLIGGWKSLERNEIFLGQENEEILRFTFSSDEFTVKLSLKNRSGKEIPFNLAYKFVEHYKDQASPILVFKNGSVLKSV